MAVLPGVLVSGNIVFDILVRPVDQIRWGATTWVESIEQHLGGNGANTSYTLGRLGVPARLLGVVGNDPFGEMCVARLESGGVDLSALGRSRDQTATTVALVDSGGARLFLHRPGASAELFPEPIEFTPELIGGFPRYHLGNVFALPGMRAHAAETLRRAKAAGLETSMDTGWDPRGEWMRLIGPCLPYTDLLFVNEDEARMLTGCADYAEAARKLREAGARNVVIKLGANGCAVFSGAGEIHSPAFPAMAIDTTGAGDCFAGGFLAALSRGETLAEAACFANAVGALSIQRLGATEGVLSWPETVAWMKTMEKSAL